MTVDPTLKFPLESALGRVFRVDTASVWAEALDHERLTRIGVGSLIAFQGANSSEYLIGVLDRVTRDLQDETILDETDLDAIEAPLPGFGDQLYAPGICAGPVEVGEDQPRQVRVLARLGRDAR